MIKMGKFDNLYVETTRTELDTLKEKEIVLKKQLEEKKKLEQMKKETSEIKKRLKNLDKEINPKFYHYFKFW